ncbi:NAD(P)-dependent oxidoreductase [Georgenia sp. Z1344]|uniref:NAD(P)-dependent oxidoreductase n=1 Tax=Georgenia sp. Z1344 TaxID=3416706 RepID=UPI003CEA9F37
MKLLVTNRSDLDLEMPDGVTVVPLREGHEIPPEDRDAEGVVAWGTPTLLTSVARDLPDLRWVQSLAAGTDLFEAAGLPADVVLTSGRGLHDATVAEHAVTLALTVLRRMPQLLAAQRESRWADELRRPRSIQPPERVASLIDARVLIWGFGSIGQRLAGILSALGASVRGVARSAGERGGYDVVAQDGLDAALAETDILVMVLPSTPETELALDARRIALLPDRAIVVNVGRGATLDEDALVDALEAGTLSGAGLDVSEQEPLPPESRLWQAPNLVYTPHVAGYRAHGGKQLIEHNLGALLAGDVSAMRNVVDRG